MKDGMGNLSTANISAHLANDESASRQMPDHRRPEFSVSLPPVEELGGDGLVPGGRTLGAERFDYDEVRNSQKKNFFLGPPRHGQRHHLVIIGDRKSNWSGRGQCRHRSPLFLFELAEGANPYAVRPAPFRAGKAPKPQSQGQENRSSPANVRGNMGKPGKSNSSL